MHDRRKNYDCSEQNVLFRTAVPKFFPPSFCARMGAKLPKAFARAWAHGQNQPEGRHSHLCGQEKTRAPQHTKSRINTCCTVRDHVEVRTRHLESADMGTRHSATQPFWTTDGQKIFLSKHRDQLEENQIGQGEENHQALSTASSYTSLVAFCTFTKRGCRGCQLHRAAVWNRANNLHNHLLEDALRCFE
jgi:hypothetical protein